LSLKTALTDFSSLNFVAQLSSCLTCSIENIKPLLFSLPLKHKLEKTFLPVQKVVLSPAEFAALFGRHYTWAYRQIKAGRIKVVTQIGRALIPRSEIGRILNQVPEHAGDQNHPQELPCSTNPNQVISNDSRPPVEEAVGKTPVMTDASTELLEERLWTTEQVADFLQVSPRTVFSLRKVGLPCIQLGGAVRFVPQRVKDHLAVNRNISFHRLRQLARRRAKSL
jgi:hypothetical protein